MNYYYIIIFTKIISTQGFIVAAFVVCAGLLFLKKKIQARLFFISTMGLMISTQVLKNVFHIPRPLNPLVEVSGYAFPSGHASGIIFLAISLSYLGRNLPKIQRFSIWMVLGLLVILVGASRVQLGVHTPFQVAAGYVLGTLWALAFMFLHRRFRE